MKLINLLALLFAALIFTGCASTNDWASVGNNTDNTAADSTEPQVDNSSGLLMDRYISGAIPGFRD